MERINKTKIPVIKATINDSECKDWDKNIELIQRDLNNSVNITTNKTPFEALYGYIPRFKDGMIRRLNVTTYSVLYKLKLEKPLTGKIRYIKPVTSIEYQ